MNAFDEALLNAIDEILRYIIGDYGAEIIYSYLERNDLTKNEIPNKLDKFSEEIRKILGDGKGQILGSAPIIEEAIAERLCEKLGTKLEGRLPMAFSIFIGKLKEDYETKGNSLSR